MSLRSAGPSRREGPDARVLDIGIGSGLLSMMAARAGATHVVTCERVPVIAETAARIIALNGYERQIRVVNKSSSRIVVGQDIEARADILISEILSSDLLAEDVEHIRGCTCPAVAQGATIIRARRPRWDAWWRAAALSEYAFVGHVSGFDVSPFGALAAQRSPGTSVHDVVAQAFIGYRSSQDDLSVKEHVAGIRRLPDYVLEDGVAVGIVQWMNIDLADDTVSNHADDSSDGGWLQVLHTFPQPIAVSAGQQLELMVGHDRASLIVMPSAGDPCPAQRSPATREAAA